MQTVDLILQLEKMPEDGTREVEIITPGGVYKISDVVFSAGKVFIRTWEKAGDQG